MSLRLFLHLSVLALGLSVATAAPGAAQAPAVDRHCDSVVAAAHVDTVDRGIFVAVVRADGRPLSFDEARRMSISIGSAFVVPRPLRVSVFGGVARMRMMRSTREASADLRAPTVTGIYRLQLVPPANIPKIRTIRSALIPEFDSAATEAIHEGSRVKQFSTFPDDTLNLDVSFETDSTEGSLRLVTARFPRVPVIDARPMASNPPASYPEEAKADSVAGEVVLRFVVARDGLPDFSTIELVRGAYLPFIRSALEALPQQRFQPATVNGCAVAQVVEYPFAFELLEPPRH